MAILRETVREEIYYRYAQLIADAVTERNPAQSRDEYWGLVTVRYRDLLAGRVQLSAILRQNLQLVQSNERCEYCGNAERLQWDHIVPLVRLGPDTIDNLVRACSRCNQRKGGRPIVEWANISNISLSRLVRGKHLKLLVDAHCRSDTFDIPVECLPLAKSRIVRIELATFPFPSPPPPDIETEPA